jgi:hypothetical protein
MLRKIGKLYFFIGRLYRNIKPGSLITRNGFIVYGYGAQLSLHNFKFYDELDKFFNPEDY